MQRDGFSIEAQRSAIQAYCKQEGIELVGEYVDEARSGTNAERENFQRMISDSKLHAFDLVVVHKLDRFSRDRYDFAVYRKLLKGNGVSIRSVVERLDDSPESIILEGMLESMAEYYSKNLARETMKGLRARARKGLCCANRPLGYDIAEGRFVINQLEAIVVREIFSRVGSGESLASISRDLASRSIRGSRGAPLQYVSLSKIVKNTIYYGSYTFAGELACANCAEPIVDFELWTAANARLQGHRNPSIRRHRVEDYLLTGLLYCGLCGGHFSGHCSHGRNGKIYRRYRCTNSTQGKCDASVVDKEAIESFVLSALEHDLVKGSIVPHVIDSLNARLKERAKSSDAGKLKKELASLEMKKTRLLDVYLDSKIEKDVFVVRSSELDTKISEMKDLLAQCELPSILLVENTVRKSAESYCLSIKQKSGKDLSRLIGALIERVILYPDRIVIVYKIKNSTGDPIESVVPREPVAPAESAIPSGALNANYGGAFVCLSATYGVASYRRESLLFQPDAVVYYTLL